IWTTASRSCLLGPLGPGLPLRWDEKSRRYFRFRKAWWRLKRVEGLRTMAERIRRAGRMRRAHRPATRRSEVRRFGDRCRERLRIKSCCLTRTDSATTERDAARTQESDESSDGMNEKDDELAHLSILARTAPAYPVVSTHY